MSSFLVTSAIRKLYRLTARKKVVQGGTSAGKTFGILPILIDKAIKTPLLEISVVSESVPHLRRGALKDFIKIMIMTKRFRDVQYNKSTMKYTFSNGSFIEFFSVDQPDKLRGARRNILYINEANNIAFESYNQLAIRTSGEIWIDFNPTAEFWAHTEVLEEEDSEFLTLTYVDNEALPDTIVADIESARDKAKKSTYWANWWKVYGLGQIGSLEGVCIPDWTPINELPDEARLISIGLDWGFANDFTTIIGLYKYNDEYIFDEMLYKKGILNKQISQEIDSLGIKDLIYCDSAEPKSIAELKSLGHSVTGVKKGKDSIVYGINLINQNKIRVTASSLNLIAELNKYTWATAKDGTKLNKPIDKYNDCIDAARYALVSVLENPNKGKYAVYY
jgi:phage terminase large subunit